MWRTRKSPTMLALILAMALSPPLAVASDIGSLDIEVIKGLYPGKAYSPHAQRSFLSRVYWGGNASPHRIVSRCRTLIFSRAGQASWPSQKVRWYNNEYR